jgi:hypothetical protein
MDISCLSEARPAPWLTESAVEEPTARLRRTVGRKQKLAMCCLDGTVRGIYAEIAIACAQKSAAIYTSRSPGTEHRSFALASGRAAFLCFS